MVDDTEFISEGAHIGLDLGRRIHRLIDSDSFGKFLARQFIQHSAFEATGLICYTATHPAALPDTTLPEIIHCQVLQQSERAGASETKGEQCVNYGTMPTSYLILSPIAPLPI